MEPVWTRLQNYRTELADVCDTVHEELEWNRNKRAHWHTWTDAWKRIWLGSADLSKNGSSGGGPRHSLTMAAAMDLTQLEITGVTVVRIAGRLDIIGSEGLEKRLTEIIKQTNRNMLLNLKEVTYMSSSGISAVLGASRAAGSMGRKVALCEISPTVKKLLEVVELGNIFPVYVREDEGLAALHP